MALLIAHAVLPVSGCAMSTLDGRAQRTGVPHFQVPTDIGEVPPEEFDSRLQAVKRAQSELNADLAELLAPAHDRELQRAIERSEKERDGVALLRAERITESARRAVHVGHSKLSDIVESRSLALKEGAALDEDFRKADESLIALARDIELGRSERDPRKFEQERHALVLDYLGLRSEAVQDTWLANARMLIGIAREAEAEDLVPRTFSAAEAVLSDSSEDIATDPADVARVKAAAERAEFAARRLISVLDTAGRIREMGLERSAWWVEDQIREIARMLNVPDGGGHGSAERVASRRGTGRAD